MEHNVVWLIITLIIMAVGLMGTFLPLIPGIPVIYGGYVVYGFLSAFTFYTYRALIGWGIVTVVTIIVDFYAGSLGARRFGASRYGVWGSVAGVVAGTLFFGLPGVIIGPFVGAVAGELIAGKPYREAFLSGWGTVIGFLCGGLFKFAVALAMIGTFLWWVLR